MKPLFSIIIATRNRIPYCINAIESILKHDNNTFELVIQDNSDNLDLKKYVSDKIFDKRLKYNYTAPPFSSIDNFNAALDLAEGEYVCLIGDDDGINPDIYKIVKWASENKIDAIVPELSAFYWWPDACHILKEEKSLNGLLRITKNTGKVSQFYTSKEVIKLMKNGGQDYLKYNLPKLYHGIIKKEYLNRIKTVTGNFIGGLSPDIYTSVALTAYIDKIIKIDYPLTIPGICNLSTSADSGSGKHSGDFESTPHLRDRGKYFWSELVPKFYSVETIWADSAIASLKDLERFKLLNCFNISTLTVLCLRKHKKYSKIILNNYYKNKESSNHISRVYYLILLILNHIKLLLFKLFSRIVRKVIYVYKNNVNSKKDKSIKTINIDNIENIGFATDELSKYLSKQLISVDLIIENLSITFNNKH